MKKNIREFVSFDTLKSFTYNRYFLISLFFIVWLLVFDTYSYFDHQKLNEEISALEDKKAYYTEELQKDSIAVEKMKKINEVERYAREKYYMKRENEDIYIIDIPESIDNQNKQ